jgi:phycoerythrin-associated linker protein
MPAPAIAVVLQQEVREQSQTIATLQQQLADLSPFASIGTHLSDWQSSDASGSAPSHQDTPTERIAKLQAQIADARRYAAIGESRINKWRSRVFNS